MQTTKGPAAQAAFAKKAAARKAAAKTTAQDPKLIEANGEPVQQEHDRERAPPSIRLLDKHEVCRIANVTFPTIWAWMREGTFPRARVVGGKSMWLSTEVEAWLAALPVRKLKGDDRSSAVA